MRDLVLLLTPHLSVPTKSPRQNKALVLPCPSPGRGLDSRLPVPLFRLETTVPPEVPWTARRYDPAVRLALEELDLGFSRPGRAGIAISERAEGVGSVGVEALH